MGAHPLRPPFWPLLALRTVCKGRGAGGRRARAARTTVRGPQAPGPLVWLAGGPEAPRPPNAAAPPGRCGFLLPYRFPTLFPFRNPPYPKSLLETAEGGFQGRAIRSPWRSTPYTLCHPGRGPLPFRSPLPLRNFSGVWGRSRPQPGVQGRGRPWPWRSQCRPLPCLHTKRPPLGRWHRKPSPLGGAFL